MVQLKKKPSQFCVETAFVFNLKIIGIAIKKNYIIPPMPPPIGG